MAAANSSRGADVWRARGLGWIEPAEGFVRLEKLLRGNRAHVAVLPIDWSRFAQFQQIQRKRSLLVNIERELPETPVTSSTVTELTAQLEAAPAQQRKQLVLEYLRNAVAGDIFL